MNVHSSDLKPDELQRLLAEQVTQDEAHGVRAYLLKRFAAAIAVAWLLSWPLPLLPHTVFWSLLAATAFAFGLMSPPRTRRSTPDKARTPPHRE
jgi:hypothetical protein